MGEPTTLEICRTECTSGCHADDCEHHGHLPDPAVDAYEAWDALAEIAALADQAEDAATAREAGRIAHAALRRHGMTA